MKKFTKSCLLTALVLFLVGVVICGVSGLLGGFRQVEQMNGIGLWNIPFGFHKDAGGDWQLGFHPYNGEIGKEWGKERYLLIPEGRENGISINAAAFTELDIELADCALYLEEAADDQIRVYVTGDKLQYYWLADGSTLCLRNAGRRVNLMDDEVHVSIPAGYTFRELEIDFGAGLLSAESLCAREADVNIGAGSCVIQEMEADKADVEVGAGSLTLESLNVKTADIEVGAGDLVIEDILVSNLLELSMSMGSATVNGTILGDFSLDCAMGDVTMELTGSEDDHGYEVECGMADVQIGHHGHGGFARSKTWNTGKNSLFDIECDMGSVTIRFEDER